MEDGTGTQAVQFLWISRTERIVSFHEEAGYDRLEFLSNKEKMEYVFQKTSNGFRIQQPTYLPKYITTRRIP